MFNTTKRWWIGKKKKYWRKATSDNLFKGIKDTYIFKIEYLDGVHRINKDSKMAGHLLRYQFCGEQYTGSRKNNF